MKHVRLRVYILAVVASLLLCSRAAAQAPLEPAQMPARTAAYLVWGGTPSGDARKANSLLALWDCPGFAPVRTAMFETMTKGTEKEASKPGLSRDEAEQYSTLLD